MLFGFSEHNQDGYHDLANELGHAVPRAHNSSGVEANEVDPDAWGEVAPDPFLVDEVCDDSNVVASNTGREIVLMCFYILSINVMCSMPFLRTQPIKRIEGHIAYSAVSHVP